jgi:hypothetical protein
VNAAASALERAGEAACIAATGISQGYPSSLSDALMLVYGDDIDAACRQARPVDQSRCPQPPCPAMLAAIEETVTAVTVFTGRISVELLAALVAAVRRLAELESKSPHEVVSDLVARTDRS